MTCSRKCFHVAHPNVFVIQNQAAKDMKKLEEKEKKSAK